MVDPVTDEQIERRLTTQRMIAIRSFWGIFAITFACLAIGLYDTEWAKSLGQFSGIPITAIAGCASIVGFYFGASAYMGKVA